MLYISYYLNGGRVPGSGEPAKEPPHQHHGQVLRGRYQRPPEDVRPGEEEEALAAAEAGAQDAGGEAAENGADAEDAGCKRKLLIA